MTQQNFCALLLSTVIAMPLTAQIGSTPERSPFRDVEKRQEVSLIVGPSFGGKDRAGAAPRGGIVFGARYDLRLGASPLAFTSSLTQQTATRDILQPGQPLANRVGRTISQSLYFFDAGLTMLLTGSKSWHSLQPMVTAGVGIATGAPVNADSSRFDFGTRFGFHVNAGVKYAPVKSRWSVRADLSNRFYAVPYPTTFSDSTPGAPRIVPLGVTKSWTRNMVLSIGLVRGFGRR
jgi:opacity protein-like surface antigen